MYLCDSLELPLRGSSREHLQHVFYGDLKKIYLNYKRYHQIFSMSVLLCSFCGNVIVMMKEKLLQSSCDQALLYIN